VKVSLAALPVVRLLSRSITATHTGCRRTMDA